MKVSKIIIALVFGLCLTLSNTVLAQHDHAKQDHDLNANASGEGGKYDAGATAFHHIADANVYSIGPLQIPLPCILYDKDSGKLSTFLSSKFHIHGTHGDGTHAYKGYVLNGGTVMKIKNPSAEMLNADHGIDVAAGSHHPFHSEKKAIDGKEKEVYYFNHGGKKYELIKKSTLDGGMFGGGLTSFYDFSITKNVVSMFIVALFLLWLFISIANTYKNNVGKAPSGKQGFFEPMFVFIQDEVAKPFLGDKWKKYLPFLLTLFFFILGLNLWGQIPFLGGSNVTGNLAFTAVLAIVAFLVTNFSGNKHYWEHVLWMPGVPAWLKIFILTPVEIAGLFIKPVTLMLRLFANITAGHIVIVIFMSLIFIFKDMAGGSDGVALGSSVVSIALTLFMMTIELLVAFIQAFVFTILTAAYISAAIEDGHHGEHEEHAHAH